jgi:hypothetical protein
VFKRARWIVMGMGMGATGSVWARRRLKRLIRSYTPPQVASRAANQAKDHWKAAVADGRSAMRAREAQLRNDVDRRNGH